MIKPPLNNEQENAHHDDHADCSADECFTAKVRYWRKHGVSTIIPANFRAVPRSGE